VYGLLRSGKSLTPFVLLALLESGESIPDNVVERGIAFLRRSTDPEGHWADRSVGADYPNYATSWAVRAECRARRKGWQEAVTRMVGYLRGQQFAEENGWKPADAPYGAWGMGGDRRTPPNTGHVDLSMTRHVLEAFTASGAPPVDPVFRKPRCSGTSAASRRRRFSCFSPWLLDANKQARRTGGYRSYEPPPRTGYSRFSQ